MQNQSTSLFTYMFGGKMNTYRVPAFVVLDIPPPVSGVIQAIRDSLTTLTSRLAVEITVAGSSGTGPIPPGTCKNETEAALKSALTGVKPFRVRFQGVRRFPNTDIFYLAPQERQPFDRIHEALKAGGIPFAPNPWPYNPHCTLRSGPMNDRASAEDILNLSFPEQEFVIDTLSVYELDAGALTCHLSFQTKFDGVS
jgi:2'-5' RNA ligase